MSIGFWQLILILIIVLLVFGAGKLPRVMGDLGKGVKSLKESLNEGKEEAKNDADKDDTSDADTSAKSKEDSDDSKAA